MSDRKICIADGAWFATEISRTTFLLSGASIAIVSNVATVTLASHLLSTGDYVTFEGVTGTGSTALNNCSWGPITKLTANTYTFPVPASVVSTSIGGTIIQEKLYFPASGDWVFSLGANCHLEYNPGNTLSTNGFNSGLDLTWRTLVPVSTSETVAVDGISYRIRDMGTTATSYLSRIS